MAKKKVLLMAAGHLSSCPRLWKEAEALHAQGYRIAIAFMQSVPQISEFDQVFMKKHREWEFHIFDWNDPSLRSRTIKYVSIIRCRWERFLNRFRSEAKQNALAMQHSAYALWTLIADAQANLFIVHHPAGLAAVAKRAAQLGVPYGYDIEDAFAYVRDGEFIENPDRLIYHTEKKYLPSAAYLSSASPMYISLYREQYHLEQEMITVLNVFDTGREPAPDVYKDRRSPAALSLYWVSQTVGMNRGLQDVFQALNVLNRRDVELHIRGRHDADTREELMSALEHEALRAQVFFHDALPASELNARNREHDVGLALELNASLNRSYCISNKIFEYMSAGLAVIATDTLGQRAVLADHPESFFLYESGHIPALAAHIAFLADHPEALRNAKAHALHLSEARYNWTQEQVPLVAKIKALLG